MVTGDDDRQHPSPKLVSSSSSPSHATFDSLPSELISYIVRLVYVDSIPRDHLRNIDLHGLPSSYSDGRRISSPHSSVQATLWALCLTSKRLFAHARPLLYRRINVTLPYSFILLIRSLGAAALATAYEQFQITGKLNQDPNDPNSFTSMVAAAGFARVLGSSLLITGPSQLNKAGSSTGAVGMSRRRSSNGDATEDELDLLWTPDPLADPTADDVTRWKVSLHPLGEDTDALQRCLRVVDFSSFRTQGMRRTIGDGIHHRFVTSARLLALITAAPDLAAFGASATMDSSLSLEVLEALLFRGGNSRRPARLRGVSIERRKKGEQLSLAAIDFTDCVSPVFEAAMEAFVARHLSRILSASGRTTETVHEEDDGHGSSAAERSTEESETDDQSELESHFGGDGSVYNDDDEEEGTRGRRGRFLAPSSSIATSSSSRSRSASISARRTASNPPGIKTTKFTTLSRLALGGLRWRTEILNPFVQSFSRLTHLDLSRTRADGALLSALAASPTLHLECLSLGHCRNLESEPLMELLVDSPVTFNLAELSLEGSLTHPTPLTRLDLETIVTQARSFKSGKMRYLDIGGCGLDDELLPKLSPQPFLLDLGLGASPNLSLKAIARFLTERAPNVQVLELSDSCYDPARQVGVSALDLSTALIGPCCTTPPLPLSLQLAAMGFQRSLAGMASEDSLLPPVNPIVPREPTNLRVIGLNSPSLKSIRDGIGAWKVIWGAGKRGWVVDTSAGPNPEAKEEDTKPDEADVDEDEDDEYSRSTSRGRLNPRISIDRRPSLKKARTTSRGRRSGYEPETPPISNATSRHASLSPSRRRSNASGPMLGRSLTMSAHPSRSRSRSRSDVRGAATALLDPSSEATMGSVEEASGNAGEQATDDAKSPQPKPLSPRFEIIRNLPPFHPRRVALDSLATKSKSGSGGFPSEVGWHSKKTEVLLGFGLMGRERGYYAFAAYGG